MEKRPIDQHSETIRIDISDEEIDNHNFLNLNLSEQNIKFIKNYATKNTDGQNIAQRHLSEAYDFVSARSEKDYSEEEKREMGGSFPPSNLVITRMMLTLKNGGEQEKSVFREIMHRLPE